MEALAQGLQMPVLRRVSGPWLCASAVLVAPRTSYLGWRQMD